MTAIKRNLLFVAAKIALISTLIISRFRVLLYGIGENDFDFKNDQSGRIFRTLCLIFFGETIINNILILEHYQTELIKLHICKL